MYILLLLIFLLMILLIYLTKKPPNFPPGPMWLPILGCSIQVGRAAKLSGGRLHDTLDLLFREWKTNVLGLKLGEQVVVAVSSDRFVSQVLDGDDFQARPNNFFAKIRNIDSRPGIVNGEGKTFGALKKFALRFLATFDCHGIASEELAEVFRMIDRDNESVGFLELIKPAVVNVVWAAIAGKRLCVSDAKFQALLKLLERRTAAFDVAGAKLAGYPWLRHLAPEWVGYNLIKQANAEMRELVSNCISNRGSSSGNDFVSLFREKNGIDSSDGQLLMIIADLFLGSVHSVGSTLDYACVMMLLHPEIQRDAQKALDRAFAAEDPIYYRHRHKVPYIEAIIMEVLRYCYVFPLGGPRRAIKTTTIGGYTVPKDTTVLYHLSGVLMSKDIWDDPHNFRPQRFLDGTKLKKVGRYFPFGLGRRRCVGEALAKKLLFVFFAEIIRRYQILPAKGRPLPSLKQREGMTQAPLPYRARFIPRRRPIN